MNHILHQIQLEITEHTYKGWLATIFLGVIAKLMIFLDVPPYVLHWTQWIMYLLAILVSSITLFGWFKKTFFKNKKDVE